LTCLHISLMRANSYSRDGADRTLTPATGLRYQHVQVAPPAIVTHNRHAHVIGRSGRLGYRNDRTIPVPVNLATMYESMWCLNVAYKDRHPAEQLSDFASYTVLGLVKRLSQAQCVIDTASGWGFCCAVDGLGAKRETPLSCGERVRYKGSRYSRLVPFHNHTITTTHYEYIRKFAAHHDCSLSHSARLSHFAF
jgi:hypothetical protein